MKRQIIKFLIVLIGCLQVTVLFADECNPYKPTFIVDGKDQWQGKAPDAIVKSIVNGISDKELYDYKLLLRELIKPYAKQGTLVLSVCNGKSKSYNVEDIMSKETEEADLSLMLARKNFFKLVSAKTSRPQLKKMATIKLIKSL